MREGGEKRKRDGKGDREWEGHIYVFMYVKKA